MAFVPPSSIPSATITGTVAVSNFPADQLVHFAASPLAVSVAALPLPDGAATEATLADAVGALDDVALTAILQREQVTP